MLVILSMISSRAQVQDPLIQVSTAQGNQGWPSVCYNYFEDEYLVLWEDYRNSDATGSDIWGQIVKSDGTLKGGEFVVCNAPGDQYWPRAAYDHELGQYLVVFEDARNGSGDWNEFDIYGVFLDKNGKKVWTNGAESDSCFGVCTQEAGQHYPAVAANNSNYHFIANTVPYDEDVPDVAYCDATNEWLVVFAWQGEDDTFLPRIYGQRVNRFGQLLKQDGTKGMFQCPISESHLQPCDFYCTDPIQPRLCFNNFEYLSMGKNSSREYQVLINAMVVWTDFRKGDYSVTDVYGQQVIFLPDSEAVNMGLKQGPANDSTFYMTLTDSLGNPGAAPWPNCPVSNADSAQYHPGLAYSQTTNEFLVGFGDLRKGEPNIYCQRLQIGNDASIHWVGDDGITPIDPCVNIPIDTTDKSEMPLIGVAHSSDREEFFITYTYGSLQSGADIYARRYANVKTGIEKDQNTFAPANFEVYQNYPNPFNPETVIRYNLPMKIRVRVTIYDIVGREIRTLLDRVQTQGLHSVRWNGTDEAGKRVASGVYFCEVQTKNQRLTRKLTLVR